MIRSKSTASLGEIEPDSPVSSPKKNQRKTVSIVLPPKNDVMNDITSSRSGRVRKAKVVFDPSDMDVKRRSLPISVEIEKSKKLTKPVVEAKKVVSPPKALAIVDKIDKKLPRFAVQANPIGNKRRQTINTTVCENPCIVCSRSDIKKGRFVNCMDCLSRGHFTCLRIGKISFYL